MHKGIILMRLNIYKKVRRGYLRYIAAETSAQIMKTSSRVFNLLRMIKRRPQLVMLRVVKNPHMSFMTNLVAVLTWLCTAKSYVIALAGSFVR